MLKWEKSNISSCSDQPPEIFHKGERVEQVSCFRYLGSFIQRRGKIAKEVQTRIGMTQTALNGLSSILWSSKFSLRLKMRLFNSNLMSILLYLCETWKPDQALEKRLLAFESYCLQWLRTPTGITESPTNKYESATCNHPSQKQSSINAGTILVMYYACRAVDYRRWCSNGIQGAQDAEADRWILYAGSTKNTER